MKPKILLISLLAIFSISLNAQPLYWYEDSPSTFEPMGVVPDFDNYSEGSKSAKITFTETGTPWFVCDEFNITANTTYNFSVDFLDNDAGGEYNVRLYFVLDDESSTYETTDYTVDNETWQTLTLTGTSPANAVKAYLVIRVVDVADAWEGSASFNIDNAIYTENGGSNLIANPSFEEWPTPDIPEGSTLVDWWEDSPDGWDPLVVVPELEKVTHGYVSAKITFTETGTPYFVSDTFDVTGSTAFDFSLDILDNDPGAEVNQRVVFINSDESTINETSSEYTEDNAVFVKYTLSGTTPENAVKAYVILRIYDVSAGWEGSGIFYIDNGSFTLGGGETNLLPNWSFEEWAPPSNLPEFLTYAFEGLTPAVNGTIDKTTHTVSLAVPFATDVTSLVATFTLSEGATAKVGETDQVSGTTSNDFTDPVTYALAAEGGEPTQDWVVTVSKDPASSAKQILSFVFEDLEPEVYGDIDDAQGTILLNVPTGTNVTALVPTIGVSPLASISPASGVAQDFTSAVTYTVTAEDESTKEYVVTVAETSETILFQEYFEGVPRVIPEEFTLINNDGYTPASEGDAAFADSAWIVGVTGRPEFDGTHIAIACSYYTDMPAEGRTDDWLVLPAITLGANSTLFWKAMSLTSSGNYPDSYRVIVAPSSDALDPTVSYFEENGTILQTINDESWSAAVGNPGDGISSRSINLNDQGYANQSVWIAFVLITGEGGGSYLALDDIKVIEGSATSAYQPNERLLDVKVFPNPANQNFNIAIYSDKIATAEVEVVDLIGRQVYSLSREVNQGESIIRLNATEFKKGIYLIRTRVNGKTNVTKLLVN
jgi:hypothetical protein